VLSESSSVSEFAAQEMSNMVWAYATMGICDLPLFHTIAQVAVSRLDHFLPQHLANTAWAFAEVYCWHEPLMRTLAVATR